MLCCGINSYLAFLDVDLIYLKVYVQPRLRKTLITYYIQYNKKK